MTDKTLPYILSDCDGTITPTYNQVLPETVNDILAYQKKSNNKFSFITGRNGIVNKQLVEDLKVTLPIVSCNGGLITDSKTWKVLHADFIDKDVVVRIIRQADDLGLTSILFIPEAIVGLKGSSRVEYWDEYRKALKKKHDFVMKLYDDLSDLATDIVEEEVEVVEIIIVAETNKQLKDMKSILAQFEEKIDFSQSHKVLFNVTKKGVNKASGLKKWAEIVNTNYQDVVVFGDNHNDIPMFEVVHHGYVMGDADKAVKTTAFKVINKMEENGVGKKLVEIMHNEY